MLPSRNFCRGLAYEKLLLWKYSSTGAFSFSWSAAGISTDQLKYIFWRGESGVAAHCTYTCRLPG